MTLILKVFLAIFAFALAIVGVSDLKSVRPEDTAHPSPWWRRLTPAGYTKASIAVITLALAGTNEYLSAGGSAVAAAHIQDLTGQLSAARFEIQSLVQTIKTDRVIDAFDALKEDVSGVFRIDFGQQVPFEFDGTFAGYFPTFGKTGALGSLAIELPYTSYGYDYVGTKEGTEITARTKNGDTICSWLRLPNPFDTEPGVAPSPDGCSTVGRIGEVKEGTYFVDSAVSTGPKVSLIRWVRALDSQQHFGSITLDESLYSAEQLDRAKAVLADANPAIFLWTTLRDEAKDDSFDGCYTFVEVPLRFQFERNSDSDSPWAILVRNGPLFATACGRDTWYNTDLMPPTSKPEDPSIDSSSKPDLVLPDEDLPATD